MNKVVYLEKTDIAATLTTWIYCAFWQMWAAEQQGYSVYINWPPGHNPPRCLQAYEDGEMFAKVFNQFEWYFKQPKVERDPNFDYRKVWTWETWVDESPVPFMSQPLYIIKDYYKKHLHFNEETNKRGQAIVDKYKIDFSKTIGITWRGTDVYLDGRPRTPIESYFPFIDEVLKPGMRIMCTAEEEEILNPLLERYSQAFTINEFVSSPHGSKHNPERLGNLSGYEKGLQPALMVWLFSKCAHYIKNRSSTGAVASWLSDGRIVSIAHEETLSYVKMDDQAEIEGKLYPLKK